MRFLAIAISYLVAVAAATATALGILAGTSLANGRSEHVGETLLGVFQLAGPALLIVLVLAAIPFVLCLLVLHFLDQDSWLAHVLAGGLVSLLAFFFFMGSLVDPGVFLEIWYIPVAGAVGGFAYWLSRHRWLREMTRV